MARAVADQVFIPFTVGGGLRTVEDMRQMLRSGADKISVNSAAVRDPSLIAAAAREFGSQAVVVAIDSRRVPGDDARSEVFISAGRQPTGLNTVQWAREVEDRGAGEILLTSMDGDGTMNGYDLDITRAVADAVRIPVIASGGAGQLSDFSDVFRDGRADAALAASLFHYRHLRIRDVKDYLLQASIAVRWTEEEDGDE